MTIIRPRISEKAPVKTEKGTAPYRTGPHTAATKKKIVRGEGGENQGWTHLFQIS